MKRPIKKRITHPFLLPALIAVLNLLSVGQAPAQTFTSLSDLHGSFDSPVFLGNAMYASLHGLVLSGNAFYGTTPGDEETDYSGAVYALNTDGSYSYTNLHSFPYVVTTGYGPRINADGAFPYAGLILSGPTLYGTTHWGGRAGLGTLFAVSTNGTAFTNLHSFGFADGTYPEAGFSLSGNIPYGTTAYGGSARSGSVFAINNSGLTNLHSFTATHTNAFGVSTNSDGAHPQAGLVLSGNTLYGTALYGGSSGNGTLFAINTNGTGFTNLHSFPGGPHLEARLILSGNSLYGTTAYGGSAGSGTVFAVNSSGFTNLHSFTATHTNTFGVATNSDGAGTMGFIFSGSTLYGTAMDGGISGNGTVFAVNTDGTGFTNLHSFTATHTNAFGFSTNSDGTGPEGLILLGNTLYGTAQSGGSSGRGAVFAVNTDGTGFNVLHSFTATYPYDPYVFSDTVFTNRGGAFPQAGLTLSGNALYGTTSSGGSLGSGTLFSISFQPQLTITPSGPNVILSWPTKVAGFDYSGYTLQSTTNPVSSAVWSTNSLAPLVIVGQNTVTNPLTGALQFYRLAQ